MPDWQHLRGKFIVLDGGEGCGKSTQARKLVHFLQDQRHLPVTLVRDPGTTDIGEKIRAILLDPASAEMAMRCEMLLYMAARAQMMAEMIRPALEGGEIVLCDRFVSSTLAYQLGGDGLTREEITAVGAVAIGGEGGVRWPDLTLIFDLAVEESQARVTAKFVPLFKNAGELPDPSKDRIEQRPIAYHRQVRQNYLAQAAAAPDRHAVIDASRDPDAIFVDVLSALGRLVQKSE
jgi:dTMP kinase